jgi:hypothetical protein
MFAVVFGLCLGAQLWLMQTSAMRQQARAAAEAQTAGLVRDLGLSDLCVATDARYVRNPALTDPVAPFMDHPGAIEHFPTGSFWSPYR